MWIHRVYSAIIVSAILFLSTALPCLSQADGIADLYARVEKLSIRINDYTLGKALTDKQKQIARRTAQENASPGTYKFKDADLYVVVDKATDRVIILYEQYDSASNKKVRELVGALSFEFGDPTLMAHDKIIYWAFDEKGKVSEEHYRQAKATKTPLKTLATIKLDSSRKILEKKDTDKSGSVYYIVSSEPVLKRIHGRTR